MCVYIYVCVCVYAHIHIYIWFRVHPKGAYLHADMQVRSATPACLDALIVAVVYRHKSRSIDIDSDRHGYMCRERDIERVVYR